MSTGFFTSRDRCRVLEQTILGLFLEDSDGSRGEVNSPRSKPVRAGMAQCRQGQISKRNLELDYETAKLLALHMNYGVED